MTRRKIIPAFVRREGPGMCRPIRLVSYGGEEILIKREKQGKRDKTNMHGLHIVEASKKKGTSLKP